MKTFSPAARVGLLTLVALALFAVWVSWLTSFSLRPRGYRLNVVYGDVNGLLPGANVMLMGVRVGRVVTVQPSAHEVTVDAEIFDRGVRLLQGSHFEIFSKGIIGEKNLEIFPPATGSKFIDPGSTLVGDDPQRFEFAVARANQALKALQKLANSPETRAAIQGVLTEARQTVERLNGLLAHTDTVVVGAGELVARTSDLEAGSGDDLRAMTRNLRELSAELRDVTRAVDSPANLRAAGDTLSNARDLSARLDHIAAEVEEFTGNPRLKRSINSAVSSSERLVETLTASQSSALPRFRVSPRFSLVGSSSGSTAVVGGDAQITLLTEHNALTAGVEDIGSANLWDLTWGERDWLGPDTGFHVGLVRSRLGLGMDYRSLPVDLQGEIFDPVNPQLRFALDWAPDQLRRKYGLMAQWIRDLRTGQNSVRFGIQWRPLD